MKWFNNLKLTVKLLVSTIVSVFLGILIGYKIQDLAFKFSAASVISILVAVFVLMVMYKILSDGVSKSAKNISIAIDRLSEGDLNFTVDGASTDEFGAIERSILVLQQKIKLLSDQISGARESIQMGLIDIKIDESEFKGFWMDIAHSFVESISEITGVLKEAQPVISKMADNDYTLNMCGKYKGEIKQFADDINTVQSRHLSVQDAFVRVSKGDTSRLDEFRKIGRHCENDKLMPSMIAMNEAIESIVAEISMVTKALADGNLEVRANPEKFEGAYRKIIEELNIAVDSIKNPMVDSLKVLKRLSENDFTTRMDSKHRGIFNDFANSINDVQEHLTHIQGIVNKISEGDISELSSLKKAGKRSENDQLVPSFISMMETIRDLINEAEMLTKEAIEGRLNTRGDAGKFRGGYMEIIQGLNRTLDAVIEPVKEASMVLNEVAKGNLNVRVEGNYKGDHAEIKNALNTTVNILRNCIGDISKVLNEISDGNLNVSTSGDYKGDFVEIKDSLNKIIMSLNQVLSEINFASEQVASGAKQVSASSQALSRGATEQASSIEEITTTMEEVASQTQHNAVNARQANELGINAKKIATHGNDRMKNMLRAMEEVNESSANISKIIKVIDDIAFQTNILALNAAVEAARAGQYGKGFAVVAEEVRNLAARSADAAKETTALIEESIRKVEAGTQIANETAGALNEIVDGVTNVANLVADIASASDEQATGIAQMNQAISQVSEVIQTNSATSEESAAASEELSGQADSLKNMVSKFKLKKVDISLGGIDGLSPDVISALESVVEKKQGMKENLDDKLEKETLPKKAIILNDADFGKY
jgi:methyl-accepting chemotaxis protein